MPHKSMIAVLATPDTSSIRTAQLQSEEYTVVPCVGLVEGVIWPFNAPSPELALASEFGRHGGDEWNGRPIVMNHPMDAEGNPQSASDPTVLETSSFGAIYNTTISEGSLKTELWINNARVEELGGEIADTVERLLAGDEVVEVSVGLFMQLEEHKGVYEGQSFDAIWRNCVPDHMALLSKGAIGACSVEKGCGAPRINNEAEFKPVMRSQLLGGAEGLKDEPPVVRNAAEDHQCECGGTCDDCQAAGDKRQSAVTRIFKRAAARVRQLMAGGELRTNLLSDSDIRTALYASMGEQIDDNWFYILAIFQESNGKGQVVYESGSDYKIYMQDFEITDSGVTVAQDRVEVRPETQFVPVKSGMSASQTGGEDDPPNVQENPMDKKTRVQGLIANERTRFGENDREWLMGLEDAQLENLEPVDAAPPAGEEEEEEEVDTDPPAGEGPRDVTQFLESAPADVRAVLESGMKMRNNRRSEQIKALTGTGRCSFTEDELKAFSDTQLDNLVALAAVPTYEGQVSLSRFNASGEGENEHYTTPPDVLGALGKKPEGGATTH